MQEITEVKESEKDDFTPLSNAKIYLSFFTFKRRENA